MGGCLRDIYRRMSDPTRSMASAMFWWAVIIMVILVIAVVGIVVFGGVSTSR
jgi:hypothetical protein